MSNQEILTKAIEKAIRGGWSGDMLDIKVEEQDNGIVRVYWDDTEWSVKDIIYNHDFAKALWGEKMVKEYHSVNVCCSQPAYAYHLQQMVIAEDAIKYLGEHLDD